MSRCKGDPELERQAQLALKPLRKISHECGVPLGSLSWAKRLLQELDGLDDPLARQIAVGKRIYESYRGGYEIGRDYQRKYAKKKAQASGHVHTDECLAYAAKTGKPFCIVTCRDSRVN